MKLENSKNLETRTVGIEDNSTVTVDDDQLGKVIGLLTTNLYSNKEGSLVREITSNAWDAHVVAGNNNPIALVFDEKDGEYYLTIRDFGNGLNEEEFNNVYRKLGTSTKTDSNDQIGGFGIGKFSALAYANKVEITSYHEGKKYLYMMFRDGTDIKTPLINIQDTDELPGLSVKVLINKDDIHIFGENIEAQLSYFENLVILNNTSLNYLTNLQRNFENINYFEGENFKANTLSLLNSESGTTALLGKISYPIDFSYLAKVDSTRTTNLLRKYKKYFKENISLKFEIGDLEVTPNREEIQYSRETVKKILDKLENSIDELYSYLEKQIKGEDFEDFAKYKSALLSNYKIQLGNENLYINTSLQILGLTDRITFKGKVYTVDFINKGVLANISFHYNIEFTGSCNDKLFSTTKKHFYASHFQSLEHILQTPKFQISGGNTLLFRDKKTTFKKIEKEYYKSLHAKNSKSPGYNRTIFADFAGNNEEEWIELVKKSFFDTYEQKLRWSSSALLSKSELPELEKFFDDIVVDELKEIYKEYSENYESESKIPKEWIEDYNKKRVIKTANRDAINTNIFRESEAGSYSSITTKDLYEEDIKDLGKLVVFANKGSEKLKALSEYLHSYTYNYPKSSRIVKELTLIGVSERNVKKLESKYDNVISLEEFMEGKTNYFRGIATSAIISKDLGKNNSYLLANDTRLQRELLENYKIDEKDFDILIKFLKKYLSYNLNADIELEILNTAMANNNLKTGMLLSYDSIRNILKEGIAIYENKKHISAQGVKNTVDYLYLENQILKKRMNVKPSVLKHYKDLFTAWQR